MATRASGFDVTFDHVSKRLGASRALDDASFHCAPGRLTIVLGSNGSGKSTALALALGLSTPDTGSVRIGGREARTAAAGRVAAVLDRGTTAPARTGRDHLRIVTGRPVSRARQDELLRLVGLEHAGDSRVATYSLGMRQRLAIAAALAQEPKVLVMDEPHNGLDPDGVTTLHSVLREHVETGGTAVVATHRVREAMTIADDVVILHAGHQAATGPAEMFQVRSRTALEVADVTAAEDLQRALDRAGMAHERTSALQIVVEGVGVQGVAGVAAAAGVAVTGIYVRDADPMDLVSHLS